jgi:acyl-CoA synthetase (AMP-forming)/AMP-acid ligase II
MQETSMALFPWIHSLQTLGVGPGGHVGLDLPNTPHSPIAFFGALEAGGTRVDYSPPVDEEARKRAA